MTTVSDRVVGVGANMFGLKIPTRTIAVLVLAAYPVAGYLPFNWRPPLGVNGTVKTAEGWLEFAAPGIASTSATPEWVPVAVQTGSFEIRLQLQSSAADQFGPARVLTLSRGHYRRNLTIGQDGPDLILRLRTPDTDLNGQPDFRVAGVFHEPAWVSVILRVDSNRVEIVVNDETRLLRSLPPEALRRWDPNYSLALGNELTGDRPWVGTIAEAVVVVGGREFDSLRSDALTLPQFWHWRNPIDRFALRASELRDILINFFGFIPLGVVSGLWLRSVGRRGCFVAFGCVIAVSLLIEVGQLWLPTRQPSITDLVLNTFGGGFGIALAYILGARYLGRCSGRET